jgi:hypothetical protein
LRLGLVDQVHSFAMPVGISGPLPSPAYGVLDFGIVYFGFWLWLITWRFCYVDEMYICRDSVVHRSRIR